MQGRNRTKRPAALTELVAERISILLALSEKEIENHPKRSHRYVLLAKKLSRRYNVRLPKLEKMRFCKKCNSPLIPGLTAKVRLNSREKCVIYACRCGEEEKLPYKAKKKPKTP